MPLALVNSFKVVSNCDKVAIALGAIRFGQRMFKVGDIEIERGVWPPLHDIRVGMQDAVCAGQRLPQLVQKLAQVVAGLSFSRVGPEGEGEMLA
jgi:hypothetical protein